LTDLFAVSPFYWKELPQVTELHYGDKEVGKFPITNFQFLMNEGIGNYEKTPV